MDFLSQSHGFDNEVSRLRSENQALAEELAQCQADKEFVWSLWKRLQVASPDITQAIGMVAQREKEKAELKDRKVLQIISLKDNKIEDLEQKLSSQSQELGLLMQKKVELQEESAILHSDNVTFRERLDRALVKIDDLEERERSRQNILREKEDLDARLHRQELENDSLRKDKQDINVIRDTQIQRIKQLEDDVASMGENYTKLGQEKHNLQQQLRSYEKRTDDLTKELDAKNKELETTRKELSELWQNHSQTTEHTSQQAELIRQLQALQSDTQKMLKNQEDAFSLETSSLQTMYAEVTTRYQSLKATEIDLKNQILNSKQKISSQERLIHKLRGRLDESLNRSASTQATLSREDKEVQSLSAEAEIQRRLDEMNTEVVRLRDQLTDKNRILHNLREDGKLEMTVSPIPSPRASRSPARGRRSLSASPHRDPNGLQRKLTKTEKKLEDTRTLLKMKMKELEELRSAHSKRLERLKALQSNHRLVRKQLKLMEEEQNGGAKKKKKLRRSDPKSLQKEDSDSVWNELAYFKNEHKNLTVENMNLGEEADTLKVQVAQDAATIHELRSCLEQEREELQFMIEQHQERSSTPESNVADQLAEAEKQLQKAQDRIKVLDADYKSVSLERDQLEDTRRALRSESNKAKQDVADKQIQITDLKREITRLQRELKKRKRKRKTDISKQYQRVLNKSIHGMSTVFDDFNKDGWEETHSESGDVTATSEQSTTMTEDTEVDSLGQSIMQCAQGQAPSGPSPKSPTRVKPTARQIDSVQEHVKRLKKQENEAISAMRPAGETYPSPPQPSPYEGFNSKDKSDGDQAPVKVVSKKTPASATAARQLTTCRQRITTLQKEVSILKSAKNASNKREAEQRKSNDMLQAEFSSVTAKLQTARFTIQRLNGDVERLKMEKEALEMESSNLNNSGAHPEHEWSSLQQRLKVASNEVSKQLAQVRHMKGENTRQEDKIEQLEAKISHLERDVAQKRSLIEDMRTRLKITKEHTKSDADLMIEVENRLKGLMETNTRLKTQVDSYKVRLEAVTKEKFVNEDKVIHISNELEKKIKQMTEMQRKSSQLQATINELEHTAQQQLHALAKESTIAISAAQHKLSKANSQIQEFHKFTKVFCHTLMASVQQARQLIQQQQNKRQSAAKRDKTPVSSSLGKAQQMACDILNMSQSDLEDLMSARDDDDAEVIPVADKDSQEARRDKKWTRKCEKLLVTKEDFSADLIELIMDKIDERNQLAGLLSSL